MNELTKFAIEIGAIAVGVSLAPVSGPWCLIWTAGMWYLLPKMDKNK